MKVAARPALERLRVFVASPGDVAAERDHVKAVADELNRGTAVQAGFVLEVVRWETHAHPDMGRAEQLILDQIGQYDLFVGIMWRRFGTPTGVAGSGTEEEFDHALRAWQQSGQPRLLCYFSRALSEPPETVDEATQLLKVTQFRSQVETRTCSYRRSAGPHQRPGRPARPADRPPPVRHRDTRAAGPAAVPATGYGIVADRALPGTSRPAQSSTRSRPHITAATKQST